MTLPRSTRSTLQNPQQLNSQIIRRNIWHRLWLWAHRHPQGFDNTVWSWTTQLIICFAGHLRKQPIQCVDYATLLYMTLLHQEIMGFECGLPSNIPLLIRIWHAHPWHDNHSQTTQLKKGLFRMQKITFRPIQSSSSSFARKKNGVVKLKYFKI